MPRHGTGRARALLITPAVIGLSLAAAACGASSPSAGVASLATTTTAVATTARATGGSSSGGSSSGGSSSGGSSSGGSSSGGELGEYATCMRSHGVLNFPGAASFGSSQGIREAKGEMVQVSRSEASSPRFEAAQRACAPYYGPPATSVPQVSAEEMRKLLAVSRCMRAHGVPNFPDPNPTTGVMDTPAGLDRASPQVLSALRACSPLGKAAGLGPPSTGQ